MRVGFFKRAAWLLVMAPLVAFVPPRSAAADPMLVIQFRGLDLKYVAVGSTYKLCDAVHCDGNFGEQIYADPLTLMTFGLDHDGDGIVDDSLGSLTTNIWADIRIDLPGLSTSGDPVVGGPTDLDNIFDLLTQSSTPGFGLALDVEGFTAAYNEVSGHLLFGGYGVTSDIFAQSLPFGLVAGTPVTFVILSEIDPFTLSTDTDGFITGFEATGGGVVVAPSAVPEPGTVVLLGAGLLALAVVRRRS